LFTKTNNLANICTRTRFCRSYTHSQSLLHTHIHTAVQSLLLHWLLNTLFPVLNTFLLSPYFLISLFLPPSPPPPLPSLSPPPPLPSLIHPPFFLHSSRVPLYLSFLYRPFQSDPAHGLKSAFVPFPASSSSRGGVTRQGVVLSDLQSLLDVNKLLSLSRTPSSLTKNTHHLNQTRRLAQTRRFAPQGCLPPSQQVCVPAASALFDGKLQASSASCVFFVQRECSVIRASQRHAWTTTGRSTSPLTRVDRRQPSAIAVSPKRSWLVCLHVGGRQVIRRWPNSK